MIKTNILRQYEESATNFKDDPFLWARFKLTVYYTIVVLVVLFFFNIAVYGLFVKNITSNLEYDGLGQEENANIELQVIDKAQGQLRTVLFTVDGLIIILILVFSYYLSDRTLKPIQISYERQKKFVADSAHELKTPLAVMKTGAEVVLNSNDKKEYENFAKDSLEEINFLSAMVNDLLFLARSDNLRKIELSKFDFGLLARRLITSMRPYAKSKRVTLIDEIQDTFYVNGNKIHFKRLLTNLIKNAVDNNKLNGKVTVSLKKSDRQVELKVSDTGTGILKTDLDHIFDRFYKADQARVKQSSGAGLGLSIVREIVKSNKGKIRIKSLPNQGTVVKVFFPTIHS